VSARYGSICKNYIRTTDKADILHAATWPQTEAVLITNDHHFARIAKEAIIDVWSTSQAIKKLPISGMR